MDWREELASWWDQKPARTILLSRGWNFSQGAIDFDNTLHISLIAGDGRSLCGQQCHETEMVTRDDLFCSTCWDSHRAINELKIGGYEFGQLTAICHDACDELKVSRKQRSSYDEYLKSDHWQHMRRVAREHYGDQCALCGQTDNLDVHHRTYARRGREMLKDLTVLCRDCHATFHRRAS